MRYKLDKFEIYGLRRPFLMLDGWVENKATKLDITADGMVLFSLPFKPTKSKIHVFHVRVALKTDHMSETCDVNIHSADDSECVMTFKTSPVSRFMQKFHYQKHAAFEKTDPNYKKSSKVYNETLQISDPQSYQYWIKHHEAFHPVMEYSYQPLISIVMPVYNVAGEYLSKCIDSILQQTYQNFEICIADDHSTNEDTLTTLKRYQEMDQRVKVLYREKNGHISEATNSALTLASGEFVGLMDNDDALMPQALNEVVRVLNEQKDLDFIYTDEDKIDLKGNRSDPQFKPDFTIDKLYGGNYICHFSVIRRSIITQIGGFRKGYEGAQDFDLFLRVTEVTNRFHHIPKVLYHWRMIPGSTALNSDSKNYAGEAGKRALQDYFDKRDEEVQLDILVHTHYKVEYIPKQESVIEIIVHIEHINEQLIKSLRLMLESLSYHNIELNLVTSQSSIIIEYLKNEEGLSYHLTDIKDTYIKTINHIIKNSKHDYFLFLDEYAKINTFNALEQMLGYVEKNKFGAVGCKIKNLYHTVVDTGYYLSRQNILPLYHSTYANDYGIYGTLLVPNCFRIIEDSCFMIRKDAIKAIHFFDDTLLAREAMLDAFLRLHEAGYSNIILPSIDVLINKVNVRDDSDKHHLVEKWAKNGFDTERDCYYNINVSNEISYRFDK